MGNGKSKNKISIKFSRDNVNLLRDNYMEIFKRTIRYNIFGGLKEQKRLWVFENVKFYEICT